MKTRIKQFPVYTDSLRSILSPFSTHISVEISDQKKRKTIRNRNDPKKPSKFRSLCPFRSFSHANEKQRELCKEDFFFPCDKNPSPLFLPLKLQQFFFACFIFNLACSLSTRGSTHAVSTSCTPVVFICVAYSCISPPLVVGFSYKQVSATECMCKQDRERIKRVCTYMCSFPVALQRLRCK